MGVIKFNESSAFIRFVNFIEGIAIMKVLDCENTDSTYESLESILGVGRGRLENIFGDFDVEGFYQRHRHPTPTAGRPCVLRGEEGGYPVRHL